jgi:serine/threonine protein kinase
MNESLKPGTVLVERYRILARIGEGGFGTVYKACALRHPEQVFAIKEINMVALSVPEKIEVTDSFNREMNLLSSLQHKNLPRIHDQFSDPEHWYLVMDYIEGQTLEDLLARFPKGRLSVEQVAWIGSQLCDVLSYLHSQSPSIIFRDVKPSNIMITPRGRLYLIDFGIARRYRAEQARDTGPLGSPGYAAPEQYGRMQSTIRTDIYGLGATLQTLLTGQDPLEIGRLGIPSDMRIPWKLRALIIQMMDEDPLKRPHDMDEVKRSLPLPFFWTGPWFWVFFSLFPASLLVGCISLFYVIVLGPLDLPYHLNLFWLLAAFYITATLIFLISWLRRRLEIWQTYRLRAQPQTAPPQQQMQK